MATRIRLEHATDLEGLGRARLAGHESPFASLPLEHVYIKLDFKPQYENARSAGDARGFLRSVARAGIAAHRLADRYGGLLLELQGSTLHVGLPIGGGSPGASSPGRALRYSAELHRVYRAVFDDPRSRVDGWRMTIDGGVTLVVSGRGVHGDESWVSLGAAANRPAKHLYAQLELPEDRRELRRFSVAARDPGSGRWLHHALDAIQVDLGHTTTIAEDTRRSVLVMDYAMGGGQILADAVPIAPSGTPQSPSADRPNIYFGWVLRTDLDGFTSRIEKCLGDRTSLMDLAIRFYRLMDDAAGFVERGTPEALVQLPWAGDNFTVAAVFSDNVGYDKAIPRRLVELSLDFEKEMAGSTAQGGFTGWAHGIAGGMAHGNSGGNIYLGGVEVDQRRFLVGAGEGFGRSTQAFGDINPRAGELVVYQPDWERLDREYRDHFEPALTRRGQQSSLYRIGQLRSLLRSRARATSASRETVVTLPGGGARNVVTRPYSS